MCGERLARAGFQVTIFDEHLAWEKPCGGGLTYKAILAYPFLLHGPQPKKLVHTIQLISSRAHRATMKLAQPIVIYSRTVLNGLLLDRAQAAGCTIVRRRVAHVDTEGERVRLAAGDESMTADFVVLAAGARNSLLPDTRALNRADLEMTLGYFVPVMAEGIQIKFLRRFEGYIWSFPRADHLSVGICGSMSRHTSQELRRHLHAYMGFRENSPRGRATLQPRAAFAAAGDAARTPRGRAELGDGGGRGRLGGPDHGRRIVLRIAIRGSAGAGVD